MIAGVSKATTLYLAPVLSLTALLLALFAFLAPTAILASEVALMSVTPSSALTDPTNVSTSVDGPTVRMGVLGSCSKPNNGAALNCTVSQLSPIYDLSVLPASAPKLLSAPTASTPVFIAISLVFSTIFVILFTLVSFRAKFGEKLSARLDNPMLNRAVAWLGLLGFLIGITAFMVLRMWYGKAVDDFNAAILQAGSSGPQILASIENGFTMVWVAYAFLAVPLVCSLAKLHVTAGKTA